MENSNRLITLWRFSTYLGPCFHFLVVLFILCMAIIPGSDDNALFIRSPTPSPRPMFESLISAGYTQMAVLLTHPQYASGLDLATFRNLTIFAPPDHALFPFLQSHALRHLSHFHASERKLSYDDLLSMRSGDRIPSLDAGHDIVIARSRGDNYHRGIVIAVNRRARVVFPNLYADSNVVVHGIDRVVHAGLHSKGRRKTNKKARKKSRMADFSSRSGNHILPFSHSLPSRFLDNLRMQKDSNAGPGGSKGQSTPSPRWDGPMQPRRSEVPRSIPQSEFKDSTIASHLWSPSSSDPLLFHSE